MGAAKSPPLRMVRGCSPPARRGARVKKIVDQTSLERTTSRRAAFADDAADTAGVDSDDATHTCDANDSIVWTLNGYGTF